VKHHQRLDYSRLAEVLHERGIGNVDAIRELLQQSREGGMPFCEALVTTNLVPDWDLSRIVCETFSLPFLPVDMVDPNAKVRADLDLKMLKSHQLIPLDRFGQVLTVIMPALVSADVLAMLSAATDLVILPVVGTVETNRRWILEHLGGNKQAEIEGGWSNLFDQADAEVNASLGGPSEGEPAAANPFAFAMPGTATGHESDELEFSLPAAGDGSGDEDSLDLGSLASLGGLGVLDTLGDDGALETSALPDDDDDLGLPPPPPSRGSTSSRTTGGHSSAGSAGGLDLPPMPEFGGNRQAG